MPKMHPTRPLYIVEVVRMWGVPRGGLLSFLSALSLSRLARARAGRRVRRAHLGLAAGRRGVTRVRRLPRLIIREIYNPFSP